LLLAGYLFFVPGLPEKAVSDDKHEEHGDYRQDDLFGRTVGCAPLTLLPYRIDSDRRSAGLCLVSPGPLALTRRKPRTPGLSPAGIIAVSYYYTTSEIRHPLPGCRTAGLASPTGAGEGP